jgi:hypothetical protein
MSQASLRNRTILPYGTVWSRLAHRGRASALITLVP